MTTSLAELTTRTAFISKSPNQVLTRRPIRWVRDEDGTKQPLGEQEWISQREEANEKRIAAGEEPLEIDRTPWKVQFTNGFLRVPEDLPPGTDEAGCARLVDWLRGHQLFNTPSGFYEQGKAPDEPRPTMTEQMTEIADAGAAGDLERLEAVKQLEEETHKRESVLVSADAGIARLREFETGAPDESRAVSDPAE